MPRLYFAAVQIEVENIDTGNIQDDKFTELIHVQRFLENNRNCEFTKVFVFDTPAVSYDLNCIISLNGKFRNNSKMNIPLVDQADSRCFSDMKF